MKSFVDFLLFLGIIGREPLIDNITMILVTSPAQLLKDPIFMCVPSNVTSILTLPPPIIRLF